MTSISDAWTLHRVRGYVDTVRAHVAALLGDPTAALHSTWLAKRRLGAQQEWTLLRHTLPVVRQLHLDLGLPSVARSGLLFELDQIADDHDLAHATIQRELAMLAQSVGDFDAMVEHAERYWTVTATLALHPIARLLRRSNFARTVYPQWSDPAALLHLPDTLDENLDFETSDARDRLLLERARWHLLLNEPTQAADLADSTLPLRRSSRGPSFVSDSCLVVARALAQMQRFADAQAYLDEARSALEQAPEEALPFDAWRDVMLEVSRLASARADRDAAWQAIEEALALAQKRRLKVERMRLLLEQARLEPDTPRGREAADRSLELASELGYLRDEGQIRLERAKHAHRTKDPDRARSELSEARWLLERLGPPERRDEALALAQALESA